MSKIIAIINQKGGVGKTATACNLAYCLSAKKKSTLLVDLDPSANASRIFLSDEPELTVKDFLINPGFISEPILSVKNLNRHDTLSDLFLIPSHISLAMTEREIGNKPFRETLLSKKLNYSFVKHKYDYVLLDCPPTLTILTINAMFAADLILVPITYSKDALEGVGDLFDLLTEIKEDHCYDIKLLRNQFDARKITANSYVSEKLEPFIDENLVLNTIIRQDERVNKASINDSTVMQDFPGSFAAQDYHKLCEEIINNYKVH